MATTDDPPDPRPRSDLVRPGTRRADLLAGAGVAAVLVPQSLAYAELAGLPAGRGLVTAAVAGVLAAVLGSAAHLQTGPTALASLLTAGALSSLVGPQVDPARLVALAALLALLTGVVRFVLGMVNGGRLASLLSQPVLVGLTIGAGVLILASQVPGMVGVEVDRANPLVALLEVPGRVSSAWPLLVGAVALAVMLALPRVAPRLPAPLLALTLAALVAELAPDGSVAELALTSGELGLRLDPLTPADLRDLAVPALVLGVIGFSEVAAIARRYATADRTAWDADRELRAQGVGAAAAGLAGGFPVSGSFSRSALLRMAGARTRLAAATASGIALLVLPVADRLPPVPRPALAAVVVAAALSLLDVGRLVTLRRVARLQATVAAGTLAATLVLAPRVDVAVVVGVGLAVAAHLFREERLHVDVTVAGDVLTITPSGVVFFASVPRLSNRAAAAVARAPEVQRLVVDLGGVGRLDASGALVLADLVEEWREAGFDVAVVDVPPVARTIFDRVVAPALED